MIPEPTNSQLSQEITEVKEMTSELVQSLHAFSESVDQRFNQIDKRFDRLEATMETMATNAQVNSLIDVLQANRVISGFEARHVKAIN